MKWMLLAFALIAGAFLPLQAGINTQLRYYTGHPVTAAFISFLVGTIVLFLLALALRLQWPSLSRFADAPWWIWTGGALGAFYVFLVVILAESLGATVMVGFIIAGQMLVSMLLDHYGWAGFSRQPVSASRILGAVMLLSGVVMIRYK